jgi:hypothetical protein
MIFAQSLRVAKKQVATCHNLPVMPIHVGIRCESCRNVYFIVTSPRIRASPTPGMYRLTCKSCPEPKEFRKEAMQPYRVSDEVFNRGYAREGEYQFVQPT